MPLEQYQQCIDACNECAVACGHCAASCLQEENVSHMRRCITLDRDCADICTLAVRYMAANSEFAAKVCALCAEICEACGEECSKHDHDHCKTCAEACFRCAKICREMAGAQAA